MASFFPFQFIVGSLKVPFLFLTNGGGIPECRRAIELSEILGVKILPSQVLQGHSPFKNLLKRYENQLIIATGKGEPALVMSEYGFKKVLSLEEYASFFENIDPVSQYKRWTTDQVSNMTRRIVSLNMTPRCNVLSESVKAVFVVSDPVDWGRDIQVLCDVLRSGGLPGQDNGHQPPLYFAADDLEYQVASMFIYFNLVRLYVPFQAAFPSQRLGMGAFRIALESVFNRIHHNALEYVSFGKPNPFVFKNAEAILSQLQLCCHEFNFKECGGPELPPLKTLYMIGDNPSVDVKGAHQAGNPWFSILTRTGVFRGESNHAEFPADLVVDTVEEAVDYILRRECSII
ncbi:uncharacterized CDP-alcohol phosphatidyltransferase class-I family protein C22A12.08c isoform X4 [Manihot esculenta]|uniref:uncharacterized CDP-alcohol phosphatidyltransferase class-I family protein C22A12.08c isoform X4 n=1 Tax=Manihot esculenta TaxID=3983 RepID=UPI001CC816FF|nr:uncharacterized CDP-alcohol phosphatidyltransferase class-I family protein C22A12.08c isoform X4 [Manihot esculenta]